MTIASTVPVTASANIAPTPLVPNSTSGSGGISFGDVLDAVNPLQHIPIISNLYRAATGSQISAGSQVVGDTMYGALLPGGAIAGLASSLANVAVKEVTGKDFGQIVVSAVTPSTPSAQTTPSSGATPLIATPATASSAAAQAASSIPAVPLLRTDHSSAQYQRAQILDAGNKLLLKMSA